MKRRDLLAECVNPDTPVDVLTQAWCSRCGNPECVRSTVGLSKFERRVDNWNEKLFIDPPKLTPDDPRFAQIAALKFITIDVGRTPEINTPPKSAWVDPEELKEPEPVPQIVTSPALVGEASPPQKEQAPPPSPPKPMVSGTSATMSLVGQNTPNQSGKVLRGSPAAPTTKGDPWSPEPPDPSEVIVQPGAKIKMGGSGV